MPERILDLFAEFRIAPTACRHRRGAGLLGALTYFGLDGMGADREEGDAGGDRQRHLARALHADEILDYCEATSTRSSACLPVMLPRIDLPRALPARALHGGGGRHGMRRHADRRADAGAAARALGRHPGRSDRARSTRTTASTRAAPSRPTGSPLALAAQGHPVAPARERPAGPRATSTFRQMAKAYPAVSPLRELRSSLADLRLNDLAVGGDGRNRTILSAFRSRTGRNQPSNTQFIFGPSVWLRGLIKPPPGYGVAYVDWSAAGIRHRRRAVRRRDHAGGLPVRRSLSRLRQAGRCRAGRRHQDDSRPQA